MFENRYTVLFVTNNGAWRYLRYPFLILNYTLVLAYCIPVYLDVPEDQENAKRVMFEMYPQACELVVSKSVIFVMTLGDDYWSNLRENALTVLVLVEIVVFVVVIRVKMNRATKDIQTSISRDTFHKHRMFIRALNLKVLTCHVKKS